MNNELTANEYHRLAMRTADNLESVSGLMCRLFPDVDREYIEKQVEKNREFFLLLNGVMGLCGEAGECIDLMKKSIFQGHEMDYKHMTEEIGDVQWYVADAASGCNATLENVMRNNIDKLMKRYPDGFDKERSIHRDGKPVKYREEHRKAKAGEKIKLVTDGGYDFNKPADVLTVDGEDCGLAFVYGKNHVHDTRDDPYRMWHYTTGEYVVLVPEEE